MAELPQILCMPNRRGEMIVINRDHFVALENEPYRNRADEIEPGRFVGGIVHLSTGDTIAVGTTTDEFVKALRTLEG